MNTGLNSQRENVTVVAANIGLRFVGISRGFTAEGATNWSRATKIGNFSLNAASFIRYLEACGRLYIIMKAPNGFLMTQR